MNILRLSTLSLAVAIAVLALAYANPSFAGKKCDADSTHPSCKDDGGDPQPCADTFPGFLYGVEATRKLPAELHLASSDACRTEPVAIGPSGAAFHMTADRSKGVIVWREQIEGGVDVVWRLDFTVDGSGNLELGNPVTILPLVGDEGLPGDSLSYGTIDIWGDATHDSLYMAIQRGRWFNSGPNAGEASMEVLIYDLSALTDVNASPDVREIYYTNTQILPLFSDWRDADDVDCSSVFFPQFVPTCYRPREWIFNPSGTRLYFTSKIPFITQSAVMRIQIDRLDAMGVNKALADWTITGPELVYVDRAPNALPRPDNDPLDLPSPEIVTAGGQFLNADQCAASYAPFADGNTDLDADFWQACIDTNLLAHGNARSWESPDSYLFDRLAQQGRGKYNIYRVYVSGGLADTEVLLIETARNADTGQ